LETPVAKKKTTTRRRSKKRKDRSSQAQRRPISLSIPSLSRDRKIDLAGVVLILLGLITALSLLSSGGGALGAGLLSLIERIFGWGSYLIPLILILMGLRIVLRHIGERLPRIENERVVGIVLTFLLLLTMLHIISGARDWSGGLALALIGEGGGLIGAGLTAALFQGFGTNGAVIAILAWILIAGVFAFRLSIPEVLDYGGRGVGWLTDQMGNPFRLRGSSAPGSQPPIESIEAIPPPPQELEGMGIEHGTLQEPIDPALAPEGSRPWTLPQVATVLETGTAGRADEAFDRERARLIEETLQSFGAPARVVEINRGPAITQFGVEPEFVEGRGGRRTKVKVSRISALADDLALALAAPSIRIEAPVPGKGYIGIEVPNMEVTLVALRDIMEAGSFQSLQGRLRIGLGKDVSGGPVAEDLTTMPHLLIAGTTGSGKSVCVNAIVSCLLLQNTPDDLRIVMVDPKRVELTYYNGIPHLLSPVVVELERVVPALQWVSREMDRRYHVFAKEGVRNIADYNRRMEQIHQRGMHYIVVVIDELADLMMLAPDETERVITRLAQLARATGIHLIIATQRPSVDVVTGLIKANFPARIAFAVASSVDSRVILDQPGAERLLGRGDMLFQSPDASAPIRMQGAFVSEAELARLIRYWKNSALGGEATQPSEISAETIPMDATLEQAPLWDEEAGGEEELDPLFDEAVQIVREMRRASISLLQRRLRIGYTRSARLVDQLEAKGIIGPAQSGSQPREVLDYGDFTSME
jgi:S-DNA-T family DNA segregation ATPase FtsK/SpoIIIE